MNKRHLEKVTAAIAFIEAHLTEKLDLPCFEGKEEMMHFVLKYTITPRLYQSWLRASHQRQKLITATYRQNNKAPESLKNKALCRKNRIS